MDHEQKNKNSMGIETLFQPMLQTSRSQLYLPTLFLPG
jgi:hypothetical protein